MCLYSHTCALAFCPSPCFESPTSASHCLVDCSAALFAMTAAQSFSRYPLDYVMRSLDMLHMAAGFERFSKKIENNPEPTRQEPFLTHPWNRNHENLRTLNCSTPETACQQRRFPTHLVKVSLATLLNVIIGQLPVFM